MQYTISQQLLQTANKNYISYAQIKTLHDSLRIGDMVKIQHNLTPKVCATKTGKVIFKKYKVRQLEVNKGMGSIYFQDAWFLVQFKNHRECFNYSDFLDEHTPTLLMEVNGIARTTPKKSSLALRGV